MSYANGRYPLSLFIHRGGNIYLTPSLNARWNELVRLAWEKYGVRLYITGDVDGQGGWNGYRPYSAQVAYKNYYCSIGKCEQAAAAGSSSHGGQYRGQEVFAADVANWAALAPGNESLAWARFTALCKAVGLTTDFVSPRERWHIGDFNPAWTVPVFGAVTTNPGTTNRPAQSEEDDMPIKDKKLVLWNDLHLFIVGDETVQHIIDDTWQDYLRDHYGPLEKIDNKAFTIELVVNKVPWDAVDAVLRGEGFGADKRSWSRLQAEGDAIRRTQATQTKTLADVLATAKSIESAPA